MGLRRTSLVLCILFILHLHNILLSVSSLPSSVDVNHETLPFSASKPDGVAFVGKARELAVVIKRGGGGGGGRGGGGGGARGGVSSRSRSRGGAGMIYPAGSTSRHHSSGNKNLRGEMGVVGWFGLSVLAGLFLV